MVQREISTMIRVFLLGTKETSDNLEKTIKNPRIQIIKLSIIKPIKLTQEIEKIKQILSSGFIPQYNIYTSKTAVKIALKELKQYKHIITKDTIAIGTATANTLKKHHIKNIIVPAQHNTQGLIQLLQQLNPTQPIATYSSDQILPQLENWIKINIPNSQTFKLYTLKPHKQNIKTFKKLIHQPNYTNIIILTAITIVDTIKNLLKRAPDIIIISMSQRITQHALQNNIYVNYTITQTDIQLIRKQIKKIIKEITTKTTPKTNY